MMNESNMELDLISRQDAIRIVDNIDTWQAGWRGNAIESMKALPPAQPEPCEDAVSRKGVAEAVEYYKKSVHHILGDCEFERVADAIHGLIRALPSVTPKPEQRWIPCEERLPEDDTLMLVNYIDERPDAMDIWIGWHEMENVWYIDGKAHSREFGNEVIAWMPLPEPYAERRTDE